jgi:hypothetical protein
VFLLEIITLEASDGRQIVKSDESFFMIMCRHLKKMKCIYLAATQKNNIDAINSNRPKRDVGNVAS